MQVALHIVLEAPAGAIQAQPWKLLWLAAVRGALMLLVFGLAAAMSAPPYIILPATFKLGASNG
jgi:hypothetical protein